MRIAFVGFGEVATAFSAALAARGHEIAAYDAAPEKSRARSLAEALRDASYVF